MLSAPPSNWNTNIISGTAVARGVPPASSYWVGASRDELRQAIAARRPHQASATARDVWWDPSTGATAALADWRRVAKWRRLLRGLTT